MRPLGEANFGASTFCASIQTGDECGANGLPLTPHSIKILGRFQSLKLIDHPRLCKYVDLVRGKHERLVVVTEHYKDNLENLLPTGKYSDPAELTKLAFGLLTGLAHLHSEGLVHRNISPHNILFDSQGLVKLTKYGMYYMTHCGADVSFPIGLAHYLAPEALAQGPVQLTEVSPSSDAPRRLVRPPSGPKVDTWAAGLVLLEAFLGKSVCEDLTVQKILRKMLSLVSSDLNPVDIIVAEQAAEKIIQVLPDQLMVLLRRCLTISPTERPLPSELLEMGLFAELREKEAPYLNGFAMFSTKLRCKDLELPSFDDEKHTCDEDEDHLAARSIEEVYYLWRLAGGDVTAVLKKAGLIRTSPPITKTARFVVDDGGMFGEWRDWSTMLDDTVVNLPQDMLRQRLKHIDEAAYYPLLEEESCSQSMLPTSPSSGDLLETSKLPLVIREKDVEYQFHRTILYERLLKAYPYKKAHIWKEARVDIPPLVRALVWATLLEVEGDVHGRYDAIDKETPIPTDRQIEVDIPRCHQYNDLLSSPVGHIKFKRLLKAWVVSHSAEYVYWQGLDSLCAPFLYLNFNDEATAFACLAAFIPKYLHKFFMKDNSSVIQEYLAVFSHLIAFHDPELGSHLDGIGFIPDLYAIPWFLTMYAHVFPLHKIFHLWDTLLLGNSSFPLCIGVAILQQLRDQLLTFGFNECILLFSDMPEIDIERCVQDSIKTFCTTPKSATYRQHGRPAKRAGDRENRPSISYYSQDYNELPKSELSTDPLTLDELKVEKCPRVSAEDLMELSELMGSSPTRSPTKKNRAAKPKLLIVDIRGPEEFNRGTVPGSINIPLGGAFSPEGGLVQCPAVQVLNGHRNQVKVIVGSRGRNAVLFAESLLHLGYSRVCVLHRGIDALRPTGLLTVPPPEL